MECLQTSASRELCVAVECEELKIVASGEQGKKGK